MVQAVERIVGRRCRRASALRQIICALPEGERDFAGDDHRAALDAAATSGRVDRDGARARSPR